MKFLIDAQLPPALAGWLRAKGYQAVAVREVGLREASDAAIWHYALKEDFVIISKDEDFAMLAGKQKGPALVWIRVGNLTNRALLELFETAWPQILMHLNSDSRVVELR